MRTLYLFSVFFFIAIFLNSGFAFDVDINGQMYRLSPVARYSGPVGGSNYYSEWHVLAAQPWYGNDALAVSLKNQVGNALNTSGRVPSFVVGRNGPTLRMYEYPYSTALNGGTWYFVKATLLIDTDSDGSYDLDDLDDDNDGLTDEEELIYGTNSLLVDSDENGINDLLDVFQVIKAQKAALEVERDSRPTQDSYDAVVAERDGRPTQAAYDAMVAERDARPTQANYDAMVAERDARPTQAAYDAMVAERDARPTQAAYDAMVAERDAKIEQFSALDSRVYELLPKVVPEAPILSLVAFNQLFAEGKQMIEESKMYATDDYHYIDFKIYRVEQQSSNGITENIEEDIDDIIDELDFSPLVHKTPYDFYPIKIKFEQAKSFLQLGDLVAFNQLFAEGKQMIEESKMYATNDYHYVDYKIGRVEEFITNNSIADIGDELVDIIDELDWSPLAHSPHYDFYPVKQKFEEVKAEADNQISIQNAYDPTPVPTATLEEYVTSLNSDLTSAIEERDSKLSMEEVRDMKLKSRMMQVEGGSASLNITLEATDNLGITSPTWSPIPENKVIIHPDFQNGKIRIDVDGDDNTNSGTKFYRFKMDD